MRVLGEERHLLLRVAPISAARVGFDQFSDREAICGFLRGNAGVFAHEIRSSAFISLSRQPKSFARESGKVRTRLPVAAKSAFSIAGKVGGTPGSPIPPILSPAAMMWTSTFGISFMRTTRY